MTNPDVQLPPFEVVVPRQIRHWQCHWSRKWTPGWKIERGHTWYLRLKERYWNISWLCDKTISTWNMNWNLWGVYLYITVRLGSNQMVSPCTPFLLLLEDLVLHQLVQSHLLGRWMLPINLLAPFHRKHCKALKAMLIVLWWTNLDLEFIAIRWSWIEHLRLFH